MAKMLDFVDKTFHQMTSAIKPFIMVSQDFDQLMGWDERLDTMLQQVVAKILGSMALIGNQAIKIELV